MSASDDDPFLKQWGISMEEYHRRRQEALQWEREKEWLNALDISAEDIRRYYDRVKCGDPYKRNSIDFAEALAKASCATHSRGFHELMASLRGVL